ncbi:hypothetical protein FISHEDRAFT_44882 [Fistulina hepatica ATCC 64428]|uniref:Glyoxylate reductase n=1 Tax=Fistulina hepatica ATCC 64428 TaxID=1128425 RepID=A0A0D7AB63_9AGAR|nr:hypothetical protein FISHEDRAFT_44882 [Fistulina hepatica ATCC 64428]
MTPLSRSVSMRLAGVVDHLTSCSKPKVVLCRDLGPQIMPMLHQADIELVAWPHDCPCSREWLLENIQGAAGVILVLGEKVNEEFLEAAGPSLRAISTMSVGYDHISLPLLKGRNIRVGYTPEVLTDAVADIAVMLALMAARSAWIGMNIVKSGKWPTMPWSPFTFCGPQLSLSNAPLAPCRPLTSPPSATAGAPPSRTIGFFGFGRIAQAALARLVPFGVTHVVYMIRSDDPITTEPTEFDREILARHPTLLSVRRVMEPELARLSDVVILLAPGGAETHHVINESFLRNMQKHAVLVNAGRGTLVDSKALAKALRERWIFAAGLDVVEGEPNVKGEAEDELVREPHCVVIPHMGSATLDTRIGMASLAVRNVLGALGLSIDGTEPSMPTELEIE